MVIFGWHRVAHTRLTPVLRRNCRRGFIADASRAVASGGQNGNDLVRVMVRRKTKLNSDSRCEAMRDLSSDRSRAGCRFHGRFAVALLGFLTLVNRPLLSQDELPSLEHGLPFPAVMASPSGRYLLCAQKFYPGVGGRPSDSRPSLALAVVDLEQFKVVAHREFEGTDFAVAMGDEFAYAVKASNGTVAALRLSDLSLAVSQRFDPNELQATPVASGAMTSGTQAIAQPLAAAVVGNQFLYVAPSDTTQPHRQLRLDLNTLQPNTAWTPIEPFDQQPAPPVERIGNGWRVDGVRYDVMLERPMRLDWDGLSWKLPSISRYDRGFIAGDHNQHALHQQVAVSHSPNFRAYISYKLVSLKPHEIGPNGEINRVELKAVLTGTDDWKPVAQRALPDLKLEPTEMLDIRLQAWGETQNLGKGQEQLPDRLQVNGNACIAVEHGKILISLHGRLYVWKPSADELAKIPPSSRPLLPQPILVDLQRTNTIKLWQPGVDNIRIVGVSLDGKGLPTARANGLEIRLEPTDWPPLIGNQIVERRLFTRNVPRLVERLFPGETFDILRAFAVEVEVEPAGLPREYVQFVLLARVHRGDWDQAVAEVQKQKTQAILDVERLRKAHASPSGESRESRRDRLMRKPWLWLAFALFTGPSVLALMVFVNKLAVRK